MKKNQNLLFIIFIVVLFYNCASKKEPICDGTIVEKEIQNGFNWDYLYSVSGDQEKLKTIVVIPNNSGICNDNYKYHKDKAINDFNYYKSIINNENTALLMPIFPRREDLWWLYSNSLDRNIMITDVSEIQREDLQLIAMINSLKTKEKKYKYVDKIIIFGFSSAGSFANRFTFMHPELVSKALIGAPGGFLILPIQQYNNKPLNYPLGIADYNNIIGKEFNINLLMNIEFIVFVGELDKDDATKYRDSYTYEEELLVKNQFGEISINRWEKLLNIYKENNLNIDFKILQKTEHEITPEVESILHDEIIRTQQLLQH